MATRCRGFFVPAAIPHSVHTEIRPDRPSQIDHADAGGPKAPGKGSELTPYQLRHTFAQGASEQVPRDVLSKLLGHKDEATARLYYEARDHRTVAAAKTITLSIAACA